MCVCVCVCVCVCMIHISNWAWEKGSRLDKSESSNALSRAQATKLKGIDKW